MNQTISLDTIETRKSTRNYRKKTLSSVDIEKINAYIQQSENFIGQYGTQFKFELLIQSHLQDKKEKIGTYGFIKNAPGFIIGCCQNDFKTIFEYGFVLEGLILYLTQLGLGTCWLGGTFKRETAMSSIELSDNNIIPAIAAIGYSEESEHVQSWVQRKIFKADKRKSPELLFFYETFDQPLLDRAEIYQKALYYLRLSPSAKNKQPWRILVSGDLSKVHFYIASTLSDNKAYACKPEYIDIGIAYKHFVIGLNNNDISGNIKVEDPGLPSQNGYIYIATWFGEK